MIPALPLREDDAAPEIRGYPRDSREVFCMSLALAPTADTLKAG